MNEFRKVEQYSPKPSTSGTGPPIVPRQESTGTLKATISLGKNPTIVRTGPFYLIKEPPKQSDLTGAANLMAHYGLEHPYKKSRGRKARDTLSSFLPNLPGQIDSPGHLDNSSLRSLIEKPPIGGKALVPLSSMQLSGFRLHPGALPDKYRMNQGPQRKKRQNKSYRRGYTPILSQQESTTASDVVSSAEKKHKQKRHDDDNERKKRKREKKKKQEQMM